MLLAASDLVCDRILYIGDRPEDEAAAKSAGFSFLWAEDWRNDRSWMN
jgi:phosphoglycolate phosphatase-like HAD superfamily hydrolase